MGSILSFGSPSALLWAALACAACGSNNASNAASSTSASSGAGPMGVQPSPATAAIWQQIQGYQKWPTFAENSTPTLSSSHMKMYVLAHYNPTVATAIMNNKVPLPDGAIIVKDNFANATDAMPMAVTIMAKQSGTWYWIEAMPNGMVAVDPMGKALEGTDVAMCKSCHDGKKDNDDVFTHTF